MKDREGVCNRGHRPVIAPALHRHCRCAFHTDCISSGENWPQAPAGERGFFFGGPSVKPKETILFLHSIP